MAVTALLGVPWFLQMVVDAWQRWGPSDFCSLVSTWVVVVWNGRAQLWWQLWEWLSFFVAFVAHGLGASCPRLQLSDLVVVVVFWAAV